jgi:hypothetical protein
MCAADDQDRALDLDNVSLADLPEPECTSTPVYWATMAEGPDKEAP